MPRVVMAPDKFKGSLSAAEVARHLAIGLEKAGLDVECVPVADGGDGTVAALATAGYATRTTEVTGPLGALVSAQWAHDEAARPGSGSAHAVPSPGPGPAPGPNREAVGARGGSEPTAVVRLAQASGLDMAAPHTAAERTNAATPPTASEGARAASPPTVAEPARAAELAKAIEPTPAASSPTAAGAVRAAELAKAIEPTPTASPPTAAGAVGRRPPGEAGAARSAVGLGSGLGEPSQVHSAAAEPIAVIELAQASGLVLSQRPLNALRATSRGTGELLQAALDNGCRRIVLGVGGSACTDGGAGMLQALGVRLLDADNRDLPPGGAALRDLAAIDAAAVPHDWHGIDLTVACDVDNPLLGPHGAATVYGPQKGASAQDVAALEAGLANFAAIVRRDLGVDVASVPGAGAAGGVAYGAMALLGAKLRSGIELVLDLLDFENRLAGADLVVTGEGRLDAQTIRGKAPAGVAAAASRAGVPTIAVAGVCELDDTKLSEAGISAVYPLSDLEPDPDRSIRDAGPLLERLAARIAAEHFPPRAAAAPRTDAGQRRTHRAI